jgi:chorismate mutase
LKELPDLKEIAPMRQLAVLSNARLFKSFAVAALCAIGFSSCMTAPAPKDDALTHLIDLVYQRMALAQPAARAKWDRQVPVIDPVHEKAALESLVARAPANGVDPVFARQFFSEVVDGVNSIEYVYYKEWANSPPQGSPPDLVNVVRPSQTRLENALMAALPAVQPIRAAPDCAARLKASLDRWQAANNPEPRRLTGLRMGLAHVCRN